MKNNTHFNEEQMAICADALNNGTYDELPKDIKVHLEECDECTNEILVIAEMARDMESASEAIADSRRKTHTYKYLWPALAVAAAISIFVILNFSGLLTTSEETQIISENKEKEIVPTENPETGNFTEPQITEKTDIANDKLIAAFEPNAKLEQLYENRQGAYRSTAVEVESPAVFYPLTADTLRWHNPSNEKLLVEIFDNKENEIFYYQTKSGKTPLPKLNKGLYYWKLMSAEYDLLFVGKLIIE